MTRVRGAIPAEKLDGELRVGLRYLREVQSLLQGLGLASSSPAWAVRPCVEPPTAPSPPTTAPERLS